MGEIRNKNQGIMGPKCVSERQRNQEGKNAEDLESSPIVARGLLTFEWLTILGQGERLGYEQPTPASVVTRTLEDKGMS